MTTDDQNNILVPRGGEPAAWREPSPLAVNMTAARLERALLVLAYLIVEDGDVHVALYEKFEAELQELRRKESAKDRARQLLATYNRLGGTSAILSRNLRLSASEGPLPYFGL